VGGPVDIFFFEIMNPELGIFSEQHDCATVCGSQSYSGVMLGSW
jgi:hypothetical protein